MRRRPHDDSDFLFAFQKGGRLDRSQFFRVFRSVAAAAGLPPDKLRSTRRASTASQRSSVVFPAIVIRSARISS